MRLLQHTFAAQSQPAANTGSFSGQISAYRPSLIQRFFKLLGWHDKPALRPNAPEVVLTHEELTGHILITGEHGFGSDHLFQILFTQHLATGGGFLMLDARSDTSLFTRASRCVSQAGRAEDFRALTVQDFALSVGDDEQTPWLRISRAMRRKEGLYAGLSVMHAEAFGEGRGQELLDGIEIAIERRSDMESGNLAPFTVVLTEADRFPAARLTSLLAKARLANVVFVLMTGSLRSAFVSALAELPVVGVAAIFRQRRGESGQLSQQLIERWSLPISFGTDSTGRARVEFRVGDLEMNQCLLCRGTSVVRCSLLP